MTEKMQFKATLIDESGNELVYVPLAFMSYEGEHFVVMHAQGEAGMENELLVLKAEEGGKKPVFSVVDNDENISNALFEGLGIGNNLVN